LLVGGQRVDKPQGHLALLPTEWEWERGRRGARTGGNTPGATGFIVANANSAADNWNSVTGGTTAVCAYPQEVSPTDAWDMAGNVWEWRLSKYGQSEDIGMEGEYRRVLRGGSLFNYPHLARCAYRRYYVPGFRSYPYVGFRLVCAPPIAGR